MKTQRQQEMMAGWVVFLLVAVLGLFYVKWFPYYHRAFTAAATHSIGKSILMGTDASPPAPSLGAALGYAVAYGKAIWQAMVLGLLLGSAVQVLLPVQWIARVLGKTGFGSVAAGGLLAIPGMMCTCCAAPVVVGLRQRQGLTGRRDRVLARQLGAQSGDARLHGLRARLELGGAAPRAGRPDGVWPRLSGQPARHAAGGSGCGRVNWRNLPPSRMRRTATFSRWLSLFARWRCG